MEQERYVLVMHVHHGSSAALPNLAALKYSCLPIFWHKKIPSFFSQALVFFQFHRVPGGARLARNRLKVRWFRHPLGLN